MRIDVDVVNSRKKAHALCRALWVGHRRGSAVGDVHRDFKTETQIGEGGGGPLHVVSCALAAAARLSAGGARAPHGLAAQWETRLARPGCCCTAARAAVASPACCAAGLRANGPLRPISAAAGPAAHGANQHPTTTRRWWPTWRRCGCIWGWSAGRCWPVRGARWWRWPMRRRTRSGCSGWCCAARLRCGGARSVACCSRRLGVGPSGREPAWPVRRPAHPCPRCWPG
jgi:hypothetical protein